ncbi:putative juvenile hormone binding protein [Trypoxylus dichotomus]
MCYKKLSIPRVLPATFDVAPCYGDGLAFILYNAYSDFLKDLKITDALFDLKNNKAEFEAALDRVEVTAKNYTILNGTFVGVKASGHGSFNMTLVKVVASFKGDIRKYKKGGEDYLELTNFKVVLNVDRGYYYFENLKSEEKDDMNTYIDENWQRFRQQLLPIVETYVRTFIYYPVNVIFKEVPINKMFLP